MDNQTKRDFKKYHLSIVAELNVSKDRVRNLIGTNHWLSDGLNKESILRKVLRNHVAQNLRIGSGYVVTEYDVSTQIDILITKKDRPVLFIDDDFCIVTPDAASCIIEVKTSITSISGFSETIDKLAANAILVRKYAPGCKIGLFVFNDLEIRNGIDKLYQDLLDKLVSITGKERLKVINWIAIGQNTFIRYWNELEVSEYQLKPEYRIYDISELAHSYFISNVVFDTVERNSAEIDKAWFTIDHGKESYMKCKTTLEFRTETSSI